MATEIKYIGEGAAEALANGIKANKTTLADHEARITELSEAATVSAVSGLQRDGKIYGVKFPMPSYSSSPLGERTQDAVDLTAEVSTDTVAGTNDFDNIPIWNFTRVNGYLDEDYNFVETAVQGDKNFALDGSNGDVYSRFQLHFYRYVWDDENYEELQLTDTYRPNEGWQTYSCFVNPDGSLKPYCYVACYEMGYNDTDGLAASISGVYPAYNTYANMQSHSTSNGVSHNSLITITTAKGSQYCGFTEREVKMLTDLFLVEFATRHSQSVMYGCGSYNYQKNPAVAETGVERVLLTETDAAYYEIGSSVSISVTEPASSDRGNGYMHTTANRATIISKETVTIDDTDYIALNLDNGGTTFDVDTTMYVSTMPWRTGACDGVLGSSGSPTSNTSGRFPMMYRGIENFYGNTYTLISDVVISDYVPYVCYDNTKFTSSAPTDDYTALNYTMATESSVYVKDVGYDEENPEIRYCTETGASSTTYYCDAYYISSGIREVLFGGYLFCGTYCGLFYRYCNHALSTTSWHFAARLSTSGRGV